MGGLNIFFRYFQAFVLTQDLCNLAQGVYDPCFLMYIGPKPVNALCLVRTQSSEDLLGYRLFLCPKLSYN